MKPYMILEGSSQAVEAFEKKVAEALEQGYSLAGELVAQSHALETRFFQPLILSEDEEEWDGEEEDEEEED